jgi:hypothetical protein
MPPDRALRTIHWMVNEFAAHEHRLRQSRAGFFGGSTLVCLGPLLPQHLIRASPNILQILGFRFVRLGTSPTQQLSYSHFLLLWSGSWFERVIDALMADRMALLVPPFEDSVLVMTAATKPSAVISR